ncbi:hypothetical protein AVEN_202658-1 [Araneus ventricosus]|uniref:H15 domain-containing protein n=1 Tax=Araneus ventricosus TaxID=182803 RepID=A0A4Y2VSC4_ARAVE|nr:hypothetical protein AVEN_202658-1 [Araneus ventricosus]
MSKSNKKRLRKLILLAVQSVGGKKGASMEHIKKFLNCKKAGLWRKFETKIVWMSLLKTGQLKKKGGKYFAKKSKRKTLDEGIERLAKRTERNQIQSPKKKIRNKDINRLAKRINKIQIESPKKMIPDKDINSLVKRINKIRILSPKKKTRDLDTNRLTKRFEGKKMSLPNPFTEACDCFEHT